jgi:4-hydroxythreonine-4-phosphate dehydrogenase
VRTSVDHGTALDIAGSGRADSGSLLEAIDAAATMARNAEQSRTPRAAPVPGLPA